MTYITELIQWHLMTQSKKKKMNAGLSGVATLDRRAASKLKLS